ncbi:MAG: S24 family peptidase [Rhodospirillaceae bacterium]|nr:S24 family peptidase [Rhodospirillaceae bacterium]
MSKLKENILRLMAEKGFNQKSLSLAAGKNETLVRDIMKRAQNPRQDSLSALAAALDVSVSDLLGEDSAPASNAPTVASIPEIDIYAGMGGGGVYSTECNQTDEFGNTIAADNVRHLWDLPVNYVRYELRVSPEKASIIEVKGDSMAPTLTSGDRVMIDTSDTSPTPPGLFAVWDGTGVVVKRVEPVHRSDPPAIRLISDNEKHQPYECTTEEAQIIGRVIWFARRI